MSTIKRAGDDISLYCAFKFSHCMFCPAMCRVSLAARALSIPIILDHDDKRKSLSSSEIIDYINRMKREVICLVCREMASGIGLDFVL